MIPSTPQETIQRNAMRVIQLMQRSIEKFNQTNNPRLAEQWNKILLNYKRAVTLKIQSKV
ncbi:MAG TPA: hypothetical protein VKM55_03235 [Candidatus Lokiarchaeia archaeon]|nr:hypothetical protein [Candidatus Lokiarchaeia archaeon]